ncbi:hypothetical protein GE09DRAFT_390678 [Coniochaeta sp. 2T2.1]|nr:hypothetical protein GE09DRAFT_390678 [Coniochaeta sp. 2T2.1]
MGSNNFANKVIALTGGASGMGYASAVLLASRGAKVSIADVNADGLERVKAEIEAGSGGAVMTTVCDIRDSNAVKSWIAATVEAWGPLDGVANIGGVIGRQIMRDTVAEIEDDDWDFVMDVNLRGMMHCLRAQIPHVKDGGSIVNFASTSGLVGHPLNGAYCASKHGVIGLSRCAARELGPKGIRVNCIAPGPIDTPMLSNSDDLRGQDLTFDMVCLKRIGKATEVAELVAWLLCDGSTFITGAVNVIDGGWVC